jgi:hypothetical protein
MQGFRLRACERETIVSLSAQDPDLAPAALPTPYEHHRCVHHWLPVWCSKFGT